MVYPSPLEGNGYELLPGAMPESWLAEEVWPELEPEAAVAEMPLTVTEEPPAVVALEPSEPTQALSPAEGTAAPSPQEAQPTGPELTAAAVAWLQAPSLFGLPRWLVVGAGGALGWWLGRR